jgi:hypothetical protein
LTNKLSIGHLVIQTVEDTFFAVFTAVINSCIEGTNFVKRFIRIRGYCCLKTAEIREQEAYV